MQPPRKKRGKSHADHQDARLPVIVFTGERRNDHFTVFVDERAVELNSAALSLLIDLVIARSKSERGYWPAEPRDICRLRKALNGVCGAGFAENLIETGSGEEYRVAIPAAQLHRHISVLPCFEELVERGVVSEVQAKELRRAVKAWHRRGIKKKSSGN